jgi:hypothetical protein
VRQHGPCNYSDEQQERRTEWGKWAYDGDVKKVEAKAKKTKTIITWVVIIAVAAIIIKCVAG